MKLLLICCILLITLIPITYSQIETRLLPVCPKENRCGYINRAGKIVIEAKFRDAHEFSEGLAAVEIKTTDGPKWGFIDSSGKIVIQPTFEQVWRFSDGLARFHDTKGYGFVNRSGTILLDLRFTTAESFSDGFALVGTEHKSKLFFINQNGDKAIKSDFTRAESFSDGLAVACSGRDCGYIDKNGTWIIPPRFYSAKPFSEGLAAVKLAEGAWTTDWGYIDKSGAFVIEPQFQLAQSFSDGLAVVGKGGPKGYVDRTGRLVIPMQYFEAYEFTEGLAVVLVRSGGEYTKEYAYIKKDGSRLSKNTYSNAMAFRDGVAWVQNGNLLTKVDVPLGLLGKLATTTSHWIDKEEKSFWMEKSSGQ